MFELSGVYFPELQFRKIGRKINHKRNERKIFGGSKMRTGIQEELELYMSKSVAQASNREIYEALLLFVQKLAAGKERAAGKKKLYYISAEFLIGKLLSNNMINLGIYDEVKEMLFQNGKDICQIEEVEPEPSLGNGGLGRLAACFLDSIATLGLPGDGIGLNYHLGLFKQEFKDHLQKELPNPWIEKQSWLTKTDVVYPVSFRGLKVNARMYDIAVTGYHDQTNKLHLFDIDSVDEGIVEDGIHFDKEDIAKNLTLFLYPDDSDEKGRLLRIYQQYFMVSSAAQMILDECVQKGSTLYDLPDYAVIQINDTHPTMVIPELIRLLVERGLDIDEAIDVVSRTCAYTNHTILAEALEKWPIGYLKKVVPQLVPIIEILDDKVRRRFSDESTAIIDRNDTVHMAHIDIHYGFSVNGVAALHTDILKQSELNHFYKIYPDKFNNKTNGITFRRWLLHCNPRLTALLDETIKDEYKEDASKLVKLLEYKDDETVLKRLLEIKKENKKDLAAYLKETQAIEIDADTIFDIQVKRLHEYKRQQLNALYIIDKYLEIKEGILPKTPITAIKGYVEGIRDGVASSPEKLDKYIRTIYNKANDMDRLIDELTFYSKIDTNKIPYTFSKINVASYFRDCVEDVGLELDASNIELGYFNYVDEDVMVIADAEQMKRVINNIISNSVKYLDKKRGIINIRIKDVGDFIQVEIEDNGKGIAAKDLPNIFDRFYRTDSSRNSSKGGSGIGLSIVRKIIEDHGGKIWATSKEGIGTEIHFVLRKYQEVIHNNEENSDH